MPQVSQKSQDLIIKVGLGIVGYLVFAKPILDFFGITKSKEDKELDNLSTDPNSPFNMYYWNKNFYFKDTGVAAKGRQFVTNGTVTRIRSAIAQIVAGFGYFQDDEQKIIGAIKSLKTKSEISLLALYMYSDFKRDLIQYLQKGRDILPENGLSDRELRIIIDYVKGLPVK